MLGKGESHFPLKNVPDQPGAGSYLAHLNRLAVIVRALMLFASCRCVVAPIGLWLCSETAY